MNANSMLAWSLLAETTAYESGQTAGRTLFLLLLLLGILKCGQRLRAPGTNTKCVLSLVLILFAWGVILGASMVAGQQPELRWLHMVGAVVSFGLIIASLVLAIMGLIDYGRNPHEYHHGRGHAVTALIMCGVFLLAGVGGAVAGFKRASQRLAVAQPSAPAGQPVRFEEMNFQFRAPAKPWVEIDAKKVNPEARLAYMRGKPEVFFMIIPERFGGAGRITTEQVVEFAKGRMRSVATSSRVVSEKPYSHNGLNGIHMETEALVSGLQTHFVYWICVTNGYSFQLLCWGRTRERDSIRREAEQMGELFQILDPHRKAPRTTSFTNFESPNYHYKVSVDDSDWVSGEALASQLPEAEFTAQNISGAGFVIVPVHLLGMEAHEEGVTRGLLSTMDIGYPNEKLSAPKSVREKHLSGKEWSFSREVEGERYAYRLKVLQGDGYAYLVAAWDEQKSGNLDALWADACGRVEFFASTNAPDPARFSKKEKETHATVLNQIGLFYYAAKQYARGLEFFKQAFALDQKNPMLLGNVIEAHAALRRPAEALDFLTPYDELVAEHPRLLANRAYLEKQVNQVDQALTNYARAFSKELQDEEHLAEYVELLSRVQGPDPALGVVTNYLKANESVRARVLQADLLKQKKAFTPAIDLLRQQRTQFPFNEDLAHALVGTYFEAGRFQESLQLCQELITNGTDSPFPAFMKGRSEYELKWYRPAKASFEEALKKAPASPDVKQFLEHVSGILGEGDNTSIKELIDPVEIPAALLEVADGQAMPEEARQYGACYDKRVTAISYLKGKEYKTTDYLVVHVLDATGVSMFSTFQTGFDPLSESVYVNRLRVTDRGGTVIATGQVADYYVTDDPNRSIISQKKVLNVPVSGLQPGCKVEFMLTRRDLGTPDEFRLVQHAFSHSCPVRENLLYVRGDIQGLKHHSSPPLEPRKIEGGLCWKQEAPMVYRWEPFQPPPASFVPMVWVCDGASGWEPLVKEYLTRIKDRFQLDSDQRQLAIHLTRGLTNSTEKLAALAAHVQTNYSYKAIEFGRRARIPQKTGDIVRNKYGDCKDHALLLQQMLEAAGIPARLALVNVRGTVQKQLPSLDQFNHMIVYLPGTEPAKFIDGTDKGSDLACAGLPDMAGQDALILDEVNPRFVTVPDSPGDASVIEAECTLSVANQTDLVVEESVTFKGSHAAGFRSYLKAVPPVAHENVFREIVGRRGGELTRFKLENLNETVLPLKIKLSYTLRRHLQLHDRQMVGKLPALLERHYLELEHVEKRLTPLQYTVPLTFQSTTRLTVPDGYRLLSDTGDKQDVKNAYFTFRGTAGKESGSFKVEAKLHRAAGKFSAVQYSAHRQAVDEALGFLERKVVLEKKRASDPRF